ncbi:uncharacterized protein LOC105776063 [Gossypium raimondii]|uniref:Uncharacterized protein n=1 Tax=Gossypium darwinii TaxID=34276 RepID=A0A5D2B3Q4_GOSDA|nr:uncharacterized protein LOC105776063 [Gossypium raimondii]TYG52027.1 hypothetical protein ES288_D10G309500v1 [Gossypium darwinii]
MRKSNERSRLYESSPIKQASLNVTRKTHIEKPSFIPRKSESKLGSERVKQKEMDNRVDPDRISLARVVSRLVKVWFDNALKEAKAGDTNMQVLVGQMNCNGFGVPKDIQKVIIYACLVLAINAFKRAKLIHFCSFSIEVAAVF